MALTREIVIKPYYEDEWVTLYQGDCLEILPKLPCVDLVVTDPPYGDTRLPWDTSVNGWTDLLRAPQLWCFGSLRFLLKSTPLLLESGWKLAQEIVWEKHNGSSFSRDRFRRVHEYAVHFYQGKWRDLFNDVPVTHDAKARSVHRKVASGDHLGDADPTHYQTEAGGPRLMRSVQKVRSCHRSAVHPTQKPLGIVVPLVQHSCPEGGVVLDPFAGSGTTLLAAKQCHRKAIGIELDERYCASAVARLLADDQP